MSQISRGEPVMGGNLMLAASLALLSYVPFEYVAKATLILCIGLFVVNPLPPYTRLLALLATMVVAVLTKWYRVWHAANKEADVVIVNDENDETKSSLAESKKDT